MCERQSDEGRAREKTGKFEKRNHDTTVRCRVPLQLVLPVSPQKG